MNNTSTPETDAHENNMCRFEFDEELAMTYSLARKLERERDEWVRKAVELCAERESNAMQALAYKAERDRLAGAIKQHQETLAMRPDYADHKLWDTLATLNQPEP